MANATFDRILARLNQAEEATTVKTAAETPAAASTEARLVSTLTAVSADLSKQAAAVAPAPKQDVLSDLSKIAQSTAAAEQDLLMKEASLLGAAIADGFMVRFTAYNEALSKTASAQTTVVASGAEEQIKQAYAKGAADMEKKAQAEYQQGFNDQLAQIHKTASQIHFAGQSMARDLVIAAKTK